MSVQRIERMCVTITGEGPTIVMLHGLGGSANVFQPLVTELERDYRIIRPELPGSARSATPLALSFEAIAEQLVAMFRVLSIKKVHLMGHSLGTLICQQLAARKPDEVQSLILFGALTEPPEAARAALKQRATLVRSEGIGSVLDAVVNATTSTYTQNNRPVVTGMVRQLLQAQTDEGYALTCEALAAAKKVSGSLIRCPVLMANGEDDVVTPPSMMTTLADQLKHGQSESLEKCGHWTTLEAARQCSELSRQFLRNL